MHKISYFTNLQIIEMTPFGEGFPTTRYPTFSGWGPISLILRWCILQMDANVIIVSCKCAYVHTYTYYVWTREFICFKKTPETSQWKFCINEMWWFGVVCKWRTSATCHIFWNETNETGIWKVKRVKVPVQHQFSAFAQVEIPDTVVAKGTMFRSWRPTSDWRRQNQ